jgi:putative ATPase
MADADLFGESSDAPDLPPAHAPLAARFRPRTLQEYVGQTHLLAPGKLLRRAIEADRFSSILLYGPPGTGKTSLAEVIARTTRSRFERLSGVESSVQDIRRVVAEASHRLARSGGKTLLFVDEIHRFNKSQQDALLPDVERGTIRLIGATTHNPFFYINAPLVSRSQVFQLEPLSVAELRGLLESARTDTERGLGHLSLHLDEAAAEFIANMADGDARRALGAMELGAMTTPPEPDGQIRITLAVAQECLQKKAIVYDGDGDAHYDTISAFIKSMRGSDPDAALYWLAKMLHAGEDIRFIARRVVICAAEDVGMADPQALTVAVAAQQAVEFVGMPEARIPLAEATVYVATAPKSNASYKAIDAALQDVRSGVTLPVPRHLRDTHYKGSEKLGHGKNYQYSHDHPGGIAPQEYLPAPRNYYTPTGRGYEKKIAERLAYWAQLRADQAGQTQQQ